MSTPRKPRTLVTHPPAIDLPPGNRPLVAPIYQSVKFETETVDDLLAMLRGEVKGFFYSRGKNPTTRQLELTLAGLQCREDAVVVGSGMAAVSLPLYGLLSAGDHVVSFIESYAPTRQALKGPLTRYGVTHTLLPVGDHAALEAVLASRPVKLVQFESPTNPMLRIADVERLCALCRQYGALSVMDNTFAGFHQYGQYPVDLFVHSLTKYASGHGDVLAGAVIGSAAMVQKLRSESVLIGCTLDPHAAFLVQRGLKTYFVRYQAQCRTAHELSAWLEQQAGVSRVLYPGLASHPQQALAAAQQQEFGTLNCVELAGGLAAATRFAEALELFAMTASLGSVDSLVNPPPFMKPMDLSPEQLAISGITPGMVRLSFGLEDIEDLRADLAQALAVASG